ncbi:hypothetical protein BJX61DRAFT_543003 [Aspergillus egyptiacus]|nr:hypothetical protein BJX61DRAFT_543003 [Aspergillus egyptiacus]
MGGTLHNFVKVLPRQSTSDSDSCSCPSTISGGGIAGIVIGSIAGTLLLIWLWRTCMTQEAIHDAETNGTPVAVSGYPSHEATHHHRRRRRRSPVGYYSDYAEKPSGSVRRPRRVYLAS